jgi:thiamine biosynthesis lipoprotein
MTTRRAAAATGRSRIALRLALLLVAAGCAGPAPDAPANTPTPVSESRIAMGTELRLTAWTDDEAAALDAFDAVYAEFERLEQLMSTWRDDSEISRINAAAGGSPVPVSPEIVEVLQLAAGISTWTNGKFDITFGAFSGLWRFDEDMDGVIPDRAAVEAQLPLIAWEDVEVDAEAGTARLARPGMSVNLGGIGKGYAVDAAVRLLRDAGLDTFLVQAGGDLYVVGEPEGRPWRLGIQDPRGPAGTPFARLELSDATFSTSGDYERFFLRDGTRYHHIIDPDLGEPARASRSVTIVTSRAVLADALSTGVFILGAEEGMALIERLDDVEGVIVDAGNQVHVSSGLDGRLEIRAPPADGP